MYDNYYADIQENKPSLLRRLLSLLLRTTKNGDSQKREGALDDVVLALK